MSITRQLAQIFIRFRPLVGLLIVVLTVLAVVGYATKGDSKHRWARRNAEREKRSDEQVLEDVNATFDLRRVEYFLVIDTDGVFTPENAAA